MDIGSIYGRFIGEYASNGRKMMLAMQSTRLAQTLHWRGLCRIFLNCPSFKNMAKSAL
jgi:hypothetical protein